MLDAVDIDPNTGDSEVDWDSWEETWSGKEVIGKQKISTDYETIRVPTGYKGKVKNKKGKKVNKRWPVGSKKGKEKGKPTRKKVRVKEQEWELEVETTQKFERKGVKFGVSEAESEVLNLGSRVVSRDLIPYMRARNVEFTAKRLKPSTQFYPFFSQIDVSAYCFPKLVEIEMVSGTFSVGENVVGGSGDKTH